MADVRRIVRIDAAGTVTVVRDIDNGSTYSWVQDSWKVTPGQRKPVVAQSQRRYGGARTVDETHDNGTLEGMILVQGATADAALASGAGLLGDLEAGLGLFIEWKPDGASQSTYLEVRGAATWKPSYRWTQFAGAKSFYLDVQIPVAPLARGATQTITFASAATPRVVQLSAAVLGDAPALADIRLDKPATEPRPNFALLGWTKRPGTPVTGFLTPFGILENDQANFVNAGDQLTGQAGYRNGTAFEANASSVTLGVAALKWPVDPSTLALDDFAPDEIDIELWARLMQTSTLVTPTILTSAFPSTGTGGGAPDNRRWTAEYGSVPKKLAPYTGAGKGFHFVRLGVITLPVDTLNRGAWDIQVELKRATPRAANDMGLDYIVCVPARRRACSPTGKDAATPGSYPAFMQSAALATKVIRSDLSGQVSYGAGPPPLVADSGLGGSPIELPAGNVDLLLKLSEDIPDEPNGNVQTETQAGLAVSGSAIVTPRYWLARSS